MHEMYFSKQNTLSTNLSVSNLFDLSITHYTIPGNIDRRTFEKPDQPVTWIYIVYHIDS